MQNSLSQYFDKKNTKLIDWYKNEITKSLSLDELPICLGDAVNTCELDIMLEAVEGCRWIVSNPKKTRNTQRDEEQFLKVQNKYKTMCKRFGIPFVGREWDSRTVFYYEDSLKEKKFLLEEILREQCGTGINRAKELAKILEEI